MQKKIKIGLLPRVIIAILLGLFLGYYLPNPAVRVFLTFNSIFSQFLGFMIPLIIIGLVTPAIAGIGKGAGKLLLATVAIAYVDTIVAGGLSYGTGTWLFPSMIASTGGAIPHIDKATELTPYFTINIPAMVDVMSSLVFSFIAGLGIAYGGLRTMENLFNEFKTVIEKVIEKAIIPLLPLYIFGVFLSMTHNGQARQVLLVFSQIMGIAYGGLRTMENLFNEFKTIIEKVIEKAIIPLLPLYIFGVFLSMTHNGQARQVLLVFSQIIIVILVLHVLILIYEFCIAGAIVKHNPFRLLWNMLPAYLTALGTSSSAATIPVTLKQTVKNGVSEEVAGFVVPLCATIHPDCIRYKFVCSNNSCNTEANSEEWCQRRGSRICRTTLCNNSPQW